MLDKIMCSVYRGRKDDETYLFVNRDTGLDPVPDELLEKFVEPKLVIEFELNESRTLARADAKAVLQGIQEKGFYLQLPPPKNPELQTIDALNELLPR